jgi:hypothetical protein
MEGENPHKEPERLTEPRPPPPLQHMVSDTLTKYKEFKSAGKKGDYWTIDPSTGKGRHEVRKSRKGRKKERSPQKETERKLCTRYT